MGAYAGASRERWGASDLLTDTVQAVGFLVLAVFVGVVVFAWPPFALLLLGVALIGWAEWRARRRPAPAAPREGDDA